jgi:hypothetical protein
VKSILYLKLATQLFRRESKGKMSMELRMLITVGWSKQVNGK